MLASALTALAGATAALHTPRSTTRRDALGLGLAAAAAAPHPAPVAAAAADPSLLRSILAADPSSPYPAQAKSAAGSRLARALESTQKQVPTGRYPSSTTLADGQTFPLASFGLQFYDDATAERLTLMAIEAGFRNFFVQSAAHNQRGFARGVKASGVPREELYICGSVTSNRAPEAAAAYKLTASDCAENLDSISAGGGIAALDALMLIPGRRDTWPDRSVRAQWRALEDFQAQGGARSLAVANFSPARLDAILLEEGRRTRPVVNQLPFCVGYHDPDVVAANARRGVHVQAWSPLGQGKLTRFVGDAPEAKQACAEVGAKYGKSACQVGLRWITQSGASFTVASASAAHFAEDLALFDWQLDAEDMARLSGLNKQRDARI